jgi:hypothetical protein
MRSMSLFFSGVLAGCSAKSSDTSTSPSGSHSYGSDICDATSGEISSSSCVRDESSFTMSDTDLISYLDSDGSISQDNCQELCFSRLSESIESYYDDMGICECSFDKDDVETYVLDCSFYTCSYPIEGRGHAGVQMAAMLRGKDPLSAWLARAAHCEASSVSSFLQLRQELLRLGAPLELTEGCLQAANDEVRHARRMGALAHAAGGSPADLRFLEAPEKDLLEFAIENAVEGCVNETYAALQASHQALHADEPFRSAFAEIAADETRHSELAWRIHDWAMEQLTLEQQALVETARREAVSRLVKSLASDDRPIPRECLGLPGNERAAWMAGQLLFAA